MSSYPLVVFHDGLSELQAAEVYSLSKSAHAHESALLRS
jgi:hypothetical protein